LLTATKGKCFATLCVSFRPLTCFSIQCCWNDLEIRCSNGGVTVAETPEVAFGDITV
jgi:hypothetical protein